jgi:hypothetical protein
VSHQHPASFIELTEPAFGFIACSLVFCFLDHFLIFIFPLLYSLLFSLGLSVISVPEGTLSKKKMWNFRS